MMKKALIMVFVIVIMILSTLNTANVEAKVKNSNKEQMVHYYSADELLLSFIQPKVHEIVQKEYGQRMPWSFVKVNEIKGIALTKEPKDWFEVKVVIAVEENSQTKFDALTIRFDEHHYNYDKNFKQNLTDISFDLLDYKKDVK
ncbi:MAG: hypothetical protein ABF649_21725, partial [Bacillus sp. (in: firmicutes)]